MTFKMESTVIPTMDWVGGKEQCLCQTPVLYFSPFIHSFVHSFSFSFKFEPILGAKYFLLAFVPNSQDFRALVMVHCRAFKVQFHPPNVISCVPPLRAPHFNLTRLLPFPGVFSPHCCLCLKCLPFRKYSSVWIPAISQIPDPPRPPALLQSPEWQQIILFWTSANSALLLWNHMSSWIRSDQMRLPYL